MRLACLATLIAAGLAFGASSAKAEDALAGDAPQYVIDVGVGGQYKPKYPGSDTYILVPYPLFSVGRFYLPGMGQRESGTTGFFMFPSFGFNGERKASDDKSLKGTKTVPWALELGLGAGVRGQYLRGFGTLRQGINGTDGQVGNLGLDVLVPISERFEMAFGPRASFASQEYMETYFGVTAKEASKGSLSKFKPDGGFKTVGIATTASYALTERTRLRFTASYNRFIEDAAKSPIVKSGSRDQWMVGVGVTYRLGFNLFN
ncbi:MipA/OmpV family protein [Bauldia litoralis]|uniref:MltA-interacting protein MipA n=1 Tax=Bauldia litoralis TaxID=665467 RepID=A0A1G6EG07_9HYPH|nr:MipA/OmpV family protein [Bauldia litoralis]SDB56230.1 MltA-interacting protein MipA [Bauldia litoralis]